MGFPTAKRAVTGSQFGAYRSASGFQYSLETVIQAISKNGFWFKIKVVLELVQSILEQFGYTLLVASNGSEALSLLNEHNRAVDLMLTDVVIPDMNGKELYTKAVEIHQSLKVLYMSGYPNEIIAHHGILEEGIKFIQKPFTMHKLLAKIREVIEE